MGPGGLLPAYPVRTLILLKQNRSDFTPLQSIVVYVGFQDLCVCVLG